MTKHKAPAPRAQRGESLAEVLVAMLIVALATLLLASMVMASAHINIAAREKDKAFYEALRKVESMEPATMEGSSYTVNISDASGVRKQCAVTVYTQDGLTLYKK